MYETGTFEKLSLVEKIFVKYFKKYILQKKLFTQELQRRVRKERQTYDMSVFADWRIMLCVC